MGTFLSNITRGSVRLQDPDFFWIIPCQFNLKLMVKKILKFFVGNNFFAYPHSWFFAKHNRQWFWMTRTRNSCKTCVSHILLPHWTYISRWLSVRFCISLKINLSNHAVFIRHYIIDEMKDNSLSISVKYHCCVCFSLLLINNGNEGL